MSLFLLDTVVDIDCSNCEDIFVAAEQMISMVDSSRTQRRLKQLKFDS